jgi:hypothetical protein
MQEYSVVRDNTSDPRETKIRWDVLKAMLDHFPELQERTEKYLLAKERLFQSSYPKGSNSTIKELMQKTIKEYQQKRLQNKKPTH